MATTNAKQLPAQDTEFVRNLETVIYGCHTASHSHIRALFDEAGLHTYFFAEYFLDQPVTKHTVANVIKRCAYFPFLPRAAEELKFRIEWKIADKKTVFHPKTIKWLKGIRDDARKPLLLSNWRPQTEGIDYWSKNGDFSDTYKLQTINSQEAILEIGKMGMVNDSAEDSYTIQLHLWSMGDVSAATPVHILRFPIASKDTYYGHFAVTFQLEAEANKEKFNEFIKKLRDSLKNLSEKRYVPTLAILHVSKWEKGLRKRLTAISPREMSPKTETTPISLQWRDSSHPFEAAFGRLWDARMNHLNNKKAAKKKAAIKEITAGIILDEYLIASPSMVDQIREVIRGAKLMQAPKRPGKSLPSALVFGEAGSGKDQMARLIPTLTNTYLTAPITTQNMAALKPALLAVPLMFGVKLRDSHQVPGIFNCAIKPLKKDARSVTEFAKPDPHVFILDELNSLDYDMQGSLLRVLENSEVAPLFSTEEPHFINALVVGIVNEDPEEVTRENEFNLLKKAEDFLGKAEAARLYTALHSARRLRPDLVYRLRRGIYVRLPPLRKRQEDIPLLFRKPCGDFIQDLVNGSGCITTINVEFELPAFDALMRPELPWPGNLRQLQAVAREVADFAYEAAVNTKGNTQFKELEEIEVRRVHVDKALRKAFPTELGADPVSSNERDD